LVNHIAFVLCLYIQIYCYLTSRTTHLVFMRSYTIWLSIFVLHSNAFVEVLKDVSYSLIWLTGFVYIYKHCSRHIVEFNKPIKR